MLCQACQAEVPLASGESIGFREACDRCGADLHVCLNCSHHDITAYNECRESSAERVLDAARANRCEYFRPNQAGSAAADSGKSAMSDLEKLFQKD